MGQVALKNTSLTPAQAMGALQAVLPGGTNQTALSMIAAQSATETAAWSQMYNWNFGNVTPTAAQAISGDYVMHANTGSMRYRAFDDPYSGAASMVDWLTSHGLLAPAEAGDLPGYMAALQAGSYLGTVGLIDGSGHTVSQDDYTNYQNDIAGLMAQYANVHPVAPPGQWKRYIAPASLLAVGGVAAWQHKRIVPIAKAAWSWWAKKVP